MRKGDTIADKRELDRVDAVERVARAWLVENPSRLVDGIPLRDFEALFPRDKSGTINAAMRRLEKTGTIRRSLAGRGRGITLKPGRAVATLPLEA